MPTGSTWTQIHIDSAQNGMVFEISFAESTDDTGVPDKYKYTVTVTIPTEDGDAVAIPQLVVYGASSTINITPDIGYAVDTITVGDTQYINDGSKS